MVFDVFSWTTLIIWPCDMSRDAFFFVFAICVGCNDNVVSSQLLATLCSPKYLGCPLVLGIFLSFDMLVYMMSSPLTICCLNRGLNDILHKRGDLTVAWEVDSLWDNDSPIIMECLDDFRLAYTFEWSLCKVLIGENCIVIVVIITLKVIYSAR